MTGQSGVTIDLSTQVNIDSVTWTDTQTQLDQLGAGIGGGSVIIGGIKVGGADTSTALDNLRLNIDSGEGVELADGSKTLAGKDALKIEVTSQDLKTVDLGIDVASIALGGNASNLMSNLTMDLELGPQYIVVHEDAADVAHIDMTGYFKVTDLDVTVDVLGMGISNLAVGAIDFANSDLSTGAYTWEGGALLTRLNTLYTTVKTKQATAAQFQAARANGATDAQIAASTNGQATEAEVTALLAADDAGVLDAKLAFLQNKVIANSDYTTAAEVETAFAGTGIELNQTASGMARYALDITTNASNQLVVNVDAFEADIAIGDITIGGGSIGSVAIDNLAVTNTSLTVYGH
jgi:hypothetical protein